MEYLSYKIIPKQDFGGEPFLIDGKMVYTGWLVTQGGCNVVPGAGWFPEIAQAIQWIHKTLDAQLVAN